MLWLRNQNLAQKNYKMEKLLSLSLSRPLSIDSIHAPHSQGYDLPGVVFVVVLGLSLARMS